LILVAKRVYVTQKLFLVVGEYFECGKGICRILELLIFCIAKDNFMCKTLLHWNFQLSSVTSLHAGEEFESISKFLIGN